MKNNKLLQNLALTGIGILTLTNIAKSQVTPSMVAPIDQQYAGYLTAGVSQDGNNYPNATYTTTSGDSYTTPVAGDGYYPGNNIRLGWAHAHNTSENLENVLTNPPSQFVKRLDLPSIPNVQSYTDSLEALFGAHSIPTSLSNPSENLINPKLYPNPADNQFNIKGLKEGVRYNVEIYNMAGQIVGTKNGVSHNGKFEEACDISGLNPGAYGVLISFDNKKIPNIGTKLVIK